MCGISGISSVSYPVNSLESLFLEHIKYRGPDNQSSQYYHDHNLLLCHTRLSIIDLSSSSNQPFVSHCGRYSLVFNGEIYNYRQLKSLLCSRHSVSFKTESDTEVLLYLLVFYPLQKALYMLDGMFAFAFYDSSKNQLALARDRFGEKPLYYTSSQSNYFAFSSSYRTLYDIPFIEKSTHNISAYLAFGCLHSPLTLSHHIHCLPPGTSLLIDLHSFEYQSSTYFTPLDDSPFIVLNDDPAVVLEDLLTQSVVSRMTADVPVGFFLSGGIDSSLIASIAAKHSLNKITTFSLGLSDDQSSELNFASKIADYIKSEHNEVKVTVDDLHYAFQLMPYVYDLPISDPSIIPSLILHKHASSFSTAFLSGDGADELFGGYNRHNAGLSIYKFFSHLPPSLRSTTLSSFTAISGSTSDSFLPRLLSLFSILSPLTRVQKLSTIDFSSDLLNYYHSTLLGSYLPLKELHDITLSDYYPDPSSFNSLFKALLALDQSFYLPDTIFTKTDRSSMFHSIEVRSPFVSSSLSNFSRSILDGTLTNGRTGKLLLSKLLSFYLPESLYARPKMGFTIDLNRFLISDGLYILNEYLCPSFFDYLPNHLVDYFRHRLFRFHAGDTSCFSDVFTMLSLSMSLSRL